jgi:signal transduction histidine kinase
MNKALEKFQEAHELYETLKNNKAIARLYNDVGNLYVKKGPKSQAKYYKRAMEYAKIGKNYEVAALCSRKLAWFAFDQEDIAEALNYAEESNRFSELSNNKEALKNASDILYQLYKKLGKFEQAFFFLENYNQLKAELDEYEWKKKKMEYEVTLQLATIDAQEKEIVNAFEKQARQARENTLVLIASVVFGVLLLVLVVALYNRYRLKIRSEQELRMLNATKDKFFSIIAHDLRNPLHGIIGIAELIEKDKKLEADKMREFNSMLLKTSRQVYDLLENLLHWARSQTNKIKYTPDALNMKKIINDTIDLFKTSANEKNILLVSDVKENLLVFADKEMITTVTRNLVSNAIKFTGDGGQVKVLANRVNNHVETKVVDTGTGISDKNLDKLFRIDAHLTTKGTKNEEGSGLGLILCKEFVERNKGEISVQSNKGEGSTFVFTLPGFGGKE